MSIEARLASRMSRQQDTHMHAMSSLVYTYHCVLSMPTSYVGSGRGLVVRVLDSENEYQHCWEGTCDGLASQCTCAMAYLYKA